MNTFHSSEPPDNHPLWKPSGESGHYCIAERHCPCGHWSEGGYATINRSGRKGKISLNYIEDNGNASR